VATEIFGVQASSLRLFALARDVERAPAEPIVALRVESVSRRLEAATYGLVQALRTRLRAGSQTAKIYGCPCRTNLWQGDVLARYHELDTVLEEASVMLVVCPRTT